MPRYDTTHPDAKRIHVFNSKGELVPLCVAVDTDEGWADVYVKGEDGKFVMSAWEQDPSEPGKMRRTVVKNRVLDKFSIRYREGA